MKLNMNKEELKETAQDARRALDRERERMVAKKASQDDLQKALRIFLNISKRKMIGKREVAKTIITEMITSAKLTLPDDIMDMLDHLDDEHPEAKVVNVAGNYNDIHDNGNVNRA